MMIVNNKNDRAVLMDEIRGFAILCMVIYHGVFALIMFQIIGIGHFTSFYFSDFMNVVRDVFVMVFIFVSGASSRLSRSNLKRGLILAAISIGLTLVTYYATIFTNMNLTIWFGILHLLSVSILIFAVVKFLLDKIKPLLGIIIFTILFLILYIAVYHMKIDIAYIFIVNYLSELFAVLFSIIFPSTRLNSSDYFPIVPWIFVFITGSYFGIYIKNKKLPAFFYKTRVPFFSLIGRYTIWIYLLHQPVIFGMIYIYKMIV